MYSVFSITRYTCNVLIEKPIVAYLDKNPLNCMEPCVSLTCSPSYEETESILHSHNLFL
jgi:hypothetical protein